MKWLFWNDLMAIWEAFVDWMVENMIWVTVVILLLAFVGIVVWVGATLLSDQAQIPNEIPLVGEVSSERIEVQRVFKFGGLYLYRSMDYETNEVCYFTKGFAALSCFPKAP